MVFDPPESWSRTNLVRLRSKLKKWKKTMPHLRLPLFLPVQNKVIVFRDRSLEVTVLYRDEVEA